MLELIVVESNLYAKSHSDDARWANVIGKKFACICLYWICIVFFFVLSLYLLLLYLHFIVWYLYLLGLSNCCNSLSFLLSIIILWFFKSHFSIIHQLFHLIINVEIVVLISVNIIISIHIIWFFLDLSIFSFLWKLSSKLNKMMKISLN